MGFSLNKVVKPQSIELNRKAEVFSGDNSPTKRPYVEGERPSFTRADVKLLFKNIKNIYKLPGSLNETVKLIKKDRVGNKKKLTRENFEELEMLIKSLGIDDYGFFEITEDRLFKGYGAPHRYALVFSRLMDKEAFASAPSMACQLEVAKVYFQTGDAANKVAKFLQNKGFGASPNHSMGGQLDYSMAAEWAGIGITGRHSMAITKKNGSCHRLSIVYTDIDNLEDFIVNDSSEFEWIKDFCKKCGKCMRKCPTGAILEEPIIQADGNPTRVNYEKCSEGFLSYGCGVCIKECPFTKGDYEKIKLAYFKNRK